MILELGLLWIIHLGQPRVTHTDTYIRMKEVTCGFSNQSLQKQEFCIHYRTSGEELILRTEMGILIRHFGSFQLWELKP